jgi:hypothetical protein
VFWTALKALSRKGQQAVLRCPSGACHELTVHVFGGAIGGLDAEKEFLTLLPQINDRVTAHLLARIPILAWILICAAQNSVLEFELFSAEAAVNNGKRLFAEPPNIGIRD